MLMQHLTPPLLARIGAGILLLIVIRSLGEVFRLEFVRGEALTIEVIRPFIVGAFAAALALGLTLLASLANRPRLSMAVTLLTIAALFIYKVFAIG
jgi:hypothetical protein